MDDYQIIWYIVAALAYFLTNRKRKKKNAQPRQAPTSQREAPRTSQKTFDDLIKEVLAETRPEEVPEKELSPTTSDRASPHEAPFENTTTVIDDEKSRQIFQESIKQAEGFNNKFSNSTTKLKIASLNDSNTENSFEEIWDGLSGDEAKKAVIYSAIFQRKYF